MIKNIFVLLLSTACCIGVWPLDMRAQTKNSQFISVTIPEKIIQDSLTQALPLTFNGTAGKLEGEITILNITNFHITNQGVSGDIDLKGDDLKLTASVAKQDIRLALGSAHVTFNCTAALRYDAILKVLYIRPMAEKIDAEDALRKGDIGKALLLFLNNREFAIAMDAIKPIIAEAGNKILTVQTDIVDINTSTSALQIKLIPTITASLKK